MKPQRNLPTTPSHRTAIRRLLARGCVLTCLAALSATAAPKTWDGSASGWWSVGANWVGGVAPVEGDDLIFPGGAGNLTCTNDLVVPQMRSLSFTGASGGYNLRSASFPLTLTNGITASHTAGANTISLPLTLGASQTFTVSSAGSLLVNSSLSLAGWTLTVNATGNCGMNGAISGAGNLTKTGAGVLTLSGTPWNSYDGTTRVNAGRLILNKSTGGTIRAGTLIIGDGAGGAEADVVETVGIDEISPSVAVVVNASGLLSLGGIYEFDELEINGGVVETFAGGRLRPASLVNRANAASAGLLRGLVELTNSLSLSTIGSEHTPDLEITANIIGASGLRQSGPGTVLLSSSNAYSGTTVVAEGTLRVSDEYALGSRSAGTVVSNGAALVLLAPLANLYEPLTLNGSTALQSLASAVCHSNLLLNTDSTIIPANGTTLEIAAVVSGTGGLTKSGPGTLQLAGVSANTYAGLTRVNIGVLELNKSSGNAIVGDLVIGSGGTGPDVVRLLNHNQITNTATVTLNAAGMFDLGLYYDTIGPLEMVGGVVTNNVSGNFLNLNGNVTATSAGSGTFPAATIACDINLGSGTRTFSVTAGPQTNDLTITRIVMGTAALQKLGDGVLRLAVSNSYSGLTLVGEGMVRMSHDSALGTTAAGTVVSNGAALFVEFGANNILEPLMLAGSGITNFGALQLEGTVSWDTGIILTGDTVVNCVAAGYTATLNGVISGTGSLTKIGPGDLLLAGSSGNTLSGNVLVNEGLLYLNKSTGASVPHWLVISDAEARNLSAAEVDRVQVNLGGLWNLNGFNDGVVELELNGGGDVATGSGVLNFGGTSPEVRVNPGMVLNAVSTLSGNATLGSATTFQVGNAPNFGNDTSDLVISAALSGAGTMTKTGSGDLSLTASNSFTSAVIVNDGELRISHAAALGTTAGGVTVNNDAVLALSGDIAVGVEPLTLNSTGETSKGALYCSGGSNSWAGGVTLSADVRVGVVTNASLRLSGSIGGTSALAKEDSGTLVMSGATANSYTGATRVNAGVLRLEKTVSNATIPGELIIGDGSGGADADQLVVVGIYQIANAGSVTVNSSGLFDLSGLTDDEAIGALAGSGHVDLGGKLLQAGDNNTSTTFSGLMSGVEGRFNKSGIGTLTLSGNNTYTGLTTAEAGTLLVNGQQAPSRILVWEDATFGGTGTVGELECQGNLTPGTSPGVLTSSNLTFNGTADYHVELNGLSPGAGYDQLNVRGTNNLANAVLHLTVAFPAETTVPVGQQFVILNNDGADLITGRFAGLPDGAELTAGGYRFRIDYRGNTGNDVVLSVIAGPASAVAASVTGGNGNHTLDPNECNHLSLVITNNTATAMTGIQAHLWTTNEWVFLTQTESSYANIPAGGKGTNATQFQVSCLPGMPCGEEINLWLTVRSDSHGSFSAPLALSSGGPGPSVAFTNSSPAAIPDGGSVGNDILVSGFTAPLAKVTVSLFVTHGRVDDLDMWLQAPDGSMIELTSDNGGTGVNYGQSCTPFENRTIFDDGAVRPITAGVAPFTGLYRPEAPLSVMRGKSGAAVNGLWRLIIQDDTVNGQTGARVCWYLNLYPATCTDGGGMCDTCPGIFQGAITMRDPTHLGRLAAPAAPSSCGVAAPCPGVVAPALYHYDTWVFTNDGPETCVTVMLDTTSEYVQAAAYLDTFDPRNQCANYLGDTGLWAPPAQRFAFTVPAKRQFVIKINELMADAGCTNYTLIVSGTPCPPVKLAIERVPAGRVRLHWPTWAAGYELQAGNSLSAPTWYPVGPEPQVWGGRFNVTNTAPASYYRFYRLHKP